MNPKNQIFKKDLPVGSIFIYGRNIYKVERTFLKTLERCERECSFGPNACVPLMFCSSTRRKDNKPVVYKQLDEII